MPRRLISRRAAAKLEPAWRRNQKSAETRILTTGEAAAADAAAAAAGLPIDVLMRRAGEAVAAAVAGMVPAGAAISVLCGPGNNGGDGYVAARLLAARGFDIAVFAARPPDPASAAAGPPAPSPGRQASLRVRSRFPSSTGCHRRRCALRRGFVAAARGRGGRRGGQMRRRRRGRDGGGRALRSGRRHGPSNWPLLRGDPHHHLLPAKARPCSLARPRVLRRDPLRRHRAHGCAYAGFRRRLAVNGPALWRGFAPAMRRTSTSTAVVMRSSSAAANSARAPRGSRRRRRSGRLRGGDDRRRSGGAQGPRRPRYGYHAAPRRDRA